MPWVTQLEDASGLSAIAGPSRVVLRSPVALQGKNFATIAEFDVARRANACRSCLTHGPSHLPTPAAVDWRLALRETEGFWRGWSARCSYTGPWREPVQRSLLTSEGADLHDDRRHRRRAHHVAAGAARRRTQLGLPLLLAARRDPDPVWLCMSAGYSEEAQAWRAWLQRSVAGSPSQIQIMYGLSGERQLIEWEVPWLPGYQGAAPVRIGNAASDQLQLDVYGELIDAIYQARKHCQAPVAAAWAQQQKLIEHLERIWQQPDDGIWEVRGGRRHFTHSKIMAWVALDRTVRDVERFKLQAPLERWRQVRDRMHATILRARIRQEPQHLHPKLRRQRA